MNVYRQFVAWGQWLAARWIFIIAALIALLSLYSIRPTYGQAATPTPDIQTVPDIPEPTATPDNTPFPTATPIQIEPPAAATDTNDTPASTGGDTPVSAVATNTPIAAVMQSQYSITLTAVVSATVLNVRRGPGDKDRMSDTLFRNDIVHVLGRNQNGTWWLVCCGKNKKQGWVNAAFLRPNFEQKAALQLLPLVSGSSVVASVGGSEAISSGVTAPANLQFEMRIDPAYPLPGETVKLTLLVSNKGPATVTQVRVRDQLPTELLYISATANNNAVVRQEISQEKYTVISAVWEQVKPGTQVSVTLTLQVDSQLANGALVDNLAVVGAEGISDLTTGITLAMPPAALPRFR